MNDEKIKASFPKTFEYYDIGDDQAIENAMQSRFAFSNFANHDVKLPDIVKTTYLPMIEELYNREDTVAWIGGSRSWDNLRQMRPDLALSRGEQAAFAPGNYDIFIGVDTSIVSMKEILDTVVLEATKEFMVKWNSIKIRKNIKRCPYKLARKSYIEA